MLHANAQALAHLTGDQSVHNRSSQHSASSVGGADFQDVPGRYTVMVKEVVDKHEADHALSEHHQGTASLDNLRSILHLRGRLQQMGATFSRLGELMTYGNPSSQGEFGQMLSLGPVYEEQWSMFFTGKSAADADGTAGMWPDLRTLKRLLRNEGVVFGRANLRINYGDSSAKLRRLCDAYDELRKQWRVTPALRLPAQDDEDIHDLIDSIDRCLEDSGFAAHADNGGGNIGVDLNCSHGTTSLTYKARDSGVPRYIGWRFSDDIEPVPRNIGWRFSDEIDPVPASSDDEYGAVADAVKKPEGVPENREVVPLSAPSSNGSSIYRASDGLFESQLLTASKIPLPPSRPGTAYSLFPRPSPLRKMITPSLTIREALSMDPRQYNLRTDTGIHAMKTEGSSVGDGLDIVQAKKKDGFRGWVQRALGRKQVSIRDRVADGSVSLFLL